MLILLPPSEGKTRPESGPALDVDGLSSPGLNRVREQLLTTLIRLSGTRRANEILGLGPTQAEDVHHNTLLREAPTARADAIYTGVLFSELGPDTLEDARARFESRVAIASALFGIVRPHDRIPAYRMSGSVSLPRLGTVASRWKSVIPQAITDLADGGLVVDLRSGTYVALGKPAAAVPTATMRVLHEKDGKRSVVSHFNKATKGRIVRQLMIEDVEAADASALATALSDLGHVVERVDQRIDVIVTDV